MERLNKERVVWIDVVKGISIFMVLIAHGTKPALYNILIVPIFLMSFLFCSGYVLGQKKTEEIKLGKTAGKLLGCFFIYVTADIALTKIIEGSPFTVDTILGTLLQVPTSQRFPESFLWWIPMQLVSTLIFQSVRKLSGDRVIQFYVLETILAFAGLAYISVIGKCLPWHIQTALFAQGMMVIGYFFQKNEDTLSLFEPLLLPILSIGYLFLVLKYRIDADLATLMFSNLGIYCAAALVGTVAFALVCRKLAGHQSGIIAFLCFVGENSLFFYAFENVARLIVGKSLASFLTPGVSLYITSLVIGFCCILLLALCCMVKNFLKKIFM